ncbi:hypothetical protein Tco_0151832 [Tanacetum coccineum]
MLENESDNKRAEVDINKKTENQAKMTKLSMEEKTCVKIKVPKSKNAKVESLLRIEVKPEPELKNTIECNLYPSDGPGKPNKYIHEYCEDKWALNQFNCPFVEIDKDL